MVTLWLLLLLVDLLLEQCHAVWRHVRQPQGGGVTFLALSLHNTLVVNSMILGVIRAISIGWKQTLEDIAIYIAIFTCVKIRYWSVPPKTDIIL